MNESMQIITEHLAIWAPSLVSILSIIVAIIPSVQKVRDHLKALREDKTLVELSNKLEKLASENKELVRCNKILIDKITKINDYADQKKKEG